MKTQPAKQKTQSKLARLSPATARVLTAVIGLPILAASILVAKLAVVFLVLAAAAMAVALFEFWVLARKQQLKADLASGYIAGAALFTVFCFAEPRKPPEPLVILFIVMLLTIGTLTSATLRGAPFDRMLISVSITVLSVLYIVLLGGHLVAIRVGFPADLSKHLLAFFFLVIMGSDSAAYYGGRAFGKYKLALSISPGKTWEGAVAGMLASLLLAAGAHYWFFQELPLKLALPLAAVMNVLSVLGDLAESALKRSAGAKDTSNILPGHGGVLDRLDSLLFNAPVIYYFARAYFNY